NNNWTGGRVEVSMMRQFHRTAGLETKLLTLLTQIPTGSLEHVFIQHLIRSDEPKQALGTIQDAAHHELREFARVVIGAVAKDSIRADDIIRLGLVKYYNQDRPQVHFVDQHTPELATHLFVSKIRTFKFALLDGRRIIPTSESTRNSASSEIVQVKVNGKRQAGEIHTLFVHEQTGVTNSGNTLLACISWMKKSDWTPLETSTFIWDDYSELGVETWVIDTYQDPKTSRLPIIVPLSNVHCQLSRGRLEHATPTLWITATMDR
ncbi:hypothetical protein R3P38DRAFT_2437191, partial [Favolaschia claudopus]